MATLPALYIVPSCDERLGFEVTDVD
uniref:Uncharacterized protein n=1 Tax=Arundo donax TaxID=35708 RepID=A0A0A9EMP1_ARUDO